MTLLRCGAALLALAFALPSDAAVRVRVANFAPLSSVDAQTAVTLKVGDTALATNLVYGQVLPYTTIAGNAPYRFQLFLPGSATPAVDQTLNLNDDRDYTVVVLGNNVNQAFGFLVSLDSANAPPAGSGWIRFLHAGANGAPITVRTQGGAAVDGLTAIPYGTPSAYVSGTAGAYDLRVTTTDGATTLADPPSFQLAAGATNDYVFAGDGTRRPYGVFALTANATGNVVDMSANGLWTTGNATRQGIAFNPVPSENRLVGSWFTWNNNGTPNWYTLDTCGTPANGTGCPNANAFDNRTAVLTVYAYTGGTFLGNGAVTQRIAGTMTVTFQSCTQANATYTIDGQSGSFAMANLVPVPNCTITP